MNKPPAVDPDKCATQAEIAFQMVRNLGRKQIDGALKVGCLMLQAKEHLGHGKLGSAFKRWKAEGMVTFSDRSLRRWMLLAKHADAIKMANLATLGEAEKLAQQLEHDAGEDNAAENEKASPQKNTEPATPEAAFESYILKVLRKLPPENQQDFLERALEIVRRRLEPFT